MLAKKDVSRDYGGKEAEMDLISSVAKSLSVNTSGEMDSLRDVLYPSLLCAAVYKVDTKASLLRHVPRFSYVPKYRGILRNRDYENTVV